MVRELEDLNWTELAQCRVEWWVFVIMVTETGLFDHLLQEDYYGITYRMEENT
jgi:hypothetical protein